ncbi:NAD(P)/FAD-dependent oxidoreductase [Herbiconiux sp. L3-i23]|uniref:protoporphyrinogen/coproporphyrinogen oxidase n=1 Tax=Herbiconiux sp. L3-i23 TaxID=2905871 RepID=UPI00204B5541|nr:FAD-dependent oxidoreductase [Herbiconiux sp. L3-i23]BDI21284.1 protoporphyrinogen oxidase [Herbiconiux sp. L3-i23]
MTRTLVIGGGVAGLVAARAAAIRGDEVTLIEADERLGGLVDQAVLGGVPIDMGAESIATRGTAIASLLGAVGLESAPVAPGGARLFLDGAVFPLPSASLLGIPGSPLADDVRRIIGTRASLRAWADRIRPELHIGRETNLGSLVRRRMGPTVLDDLVRPVVEGVYGVDPDDADVDALIPGLNTALTRAGSLSGAVLSLRSGAPAGAAVAGIAGGVGALVAALADSLVAVGGEIRRSSPALAIARAADRFEVAIPDGTLEADRVVVATPGPVARRLLRETVPTGEWPRSRTSRAVAVMLDAPSLDQAPLGTGVLVARPSEGGPTALTHSSAKWPWLREILPPSRHVIRLSYRGDGPPVGVAKAVADAATLFGAPLQESAVVGSAEHTWVQDAPRALLGVRAAAEEFERAVREVDGLAVTGAWIAGTGIASIVPHAQAAGAA